ncbi:Restriction of telomere capping protein 5 [Frankliniella fusca]|uniref:Restriction of telomere capping protein 5 n=1 Tax=Frankliniella fusca TaxID=407009 RepID=A0AAE1H4L6_9NEOP|nr:Restriction of telomere capping protein 5 [Frankliniella fusca]
MERKKAYDIREKVKVAMGSLLKASAAFGWGTSSTTQLDEEFAVWGSSGSGGTTWHHDEVPAGNDWVWVSGGDGMAGCRRQAGGWAERGAELRGAALPQ